MQDNSTSFYPIDLKFSGDCFLWQELGNRPLTKVFTNLKKCYDENKNFEKLLFTKDFIIIFLIYGFLS